MYGTITFTSATGRYSISASFAGIYTVGDGTTTDTHVLVNGPDFFHGNVRGYAVNLNFLPQPSHSRDAKMLTLTGLTATRQG